MIHLKRLGVGLSIFIPFLAAFALFAEYPLVLLPIAIITFAYVIGDALLS